MGSNPFGFFCGLYLYCNCEDLFHFYSLSAVHSYDLYHICTSHDMTCTCTLDHSQIASRALLADRSVIHAHVVSCNTAEIHLTSFRAGPVLVHVYCTVETCHDRCRYIWRWQEWTMQNRTDFCSVYYVVYPNSISKTPVFLVLCCTSSQFSYSVAAQSSTQTLSKFSDVWHSIKWKRSLVLETATV